MRLQNIKNRVVAAFLVLSPLMSMGSALPVSAVDQDCTWTGATNLSFNTAGNWTGCGGGVPGTGDNLVFDVTSLAESPTIDNDIVGLSVKTVTFQGTNASYYDFTLQGNEFTVTNGFSVATDLYPSIDNDIVFSGTVTVTGNSPTFSGNISGSGTISGSIYASGASTYSGTITMSGYGSMSAEALPASTTVVAPDGSSLNVGGCADATPKTVAANFVLSGGGRTNPNPGFPAYPKVTTGAGCAGAAVDYGQYTAVNQKYTLTGSVTLGSDIVWGTMAGETTLSGALSGSYAITLSDNFGGKLIISGSSNGTTTANGTYTSPPQVVVISDSQPSTPLAIGSGAVVTVNGSRGDTSVFSGATLKGNGTVGNLDVQTGGKLAVGNSPGCMNTGNLTLAGSYDVEIGGATACTGYDQTNVTGTVDVTGGTLNVAMVNSFGATAGQQFIVINNDGSDAVTGTFAGLTNGAVFAVGDGQFRVNYDGGTGNDVVLTVITAPTVPDTGFELLRTNPFITLGLTVLAAVGMLVVARRSRATR